MINVVGIKFKQNGVIEYFNPEKNEYKVGTGVICESSLGIQYGEVCIPNTEIDETKLDCELPLKPIIRYANLKDKEKVKANKQKAMNAFIQTDAIIKKNNLEMKLLEAEYSFDCTKLLFTFSSEDRVDFRELVKELATIFKVRIELRQVGIREEVKSIGGIGPCGRETCCATFLKEYGKVGIKMAKTQNLSLNPTKLNGLCGKIMCCIGYENEQYAENLEKMPKVNSEVLTPLGPGIVQFNNILAKKVTVKLNEDAKTVEYNLDEIKFNNEPKH